MLKKVIEFPTNFSNGLYSSFARDQIFNQSKNIGTWLHHPNVTKHPKRWSGQTPKFNPVRVHGRECSSRCIVVGVRKVVTPRQKIQIKRVANSTHLLPNWSRRRLATGLMHLQSLFRCQSGSHNFEYKEISGGAVCHNTECSPQFHPRINSFHIERQHCRRVVSFALLMF